MRHWLRFAAVSTFAVKFFQLLLNVSGRRIFVESIPVVLARLPELVTFTHAGMVAGSLMALVVRKTGG